MIPRAARWRAVGCRYLLRIAVLPPFLALIPLLHAAEVTRGPYLQMGTTDGVVVRWRTDLPTDSRVLYGSKLGQLSSAVDDPTLTTEHEIRLTGLFSGAPYYYAIGTTTELLAGDDPDHYFFVAPATGTRQPTRIWVIGDAGEGTPQAMAVRDAYYAYTGDEHTDVWLMLGDNAMPSGTDAEYQTKFFDVYDGLLLQTAVWPTLGNHDSVSSDSMTQSGPYYDSFTLPSLAEAGGLPSGTEAYYSFDHANIHFVVLDSQDTYRLTGGAMLTWLDLDLAQTEQEWIIAYWHHPPYSKGAHDSDIEYQQIEMRENALPILEDHGVDLVLSGHCHSYERSYLIQGFYATPTVVPGDGVILDAGDGREDGDGAYSKLERGAPSYDLPGTVYTVAGSSGKVSGGSLDHPVMYISHNIMGSVVLDVDGDRLEATFLDLDGIVRDYFTLHRGCANGDDDGDDVCNEDDNCPDAPNPDQADGDSDGIGDVCEDPTDNDGDGVLNENDNCPDAANPDQTDGDGDGYGDACDNCPDNRNANQRDEDLDGVGNLCDNCPEQFNPDQADADSDGTGDVCDDATDSDSDGRPDDDDNCPFVPNADQTNSDTDSYGDACDNCPQLRNQNQQDDDGDGVGSACDNCLDVPNPDQQDSDSDGIGDACDEGVDSDSDGVWDIVDCAPMIPGVGSLPGTIGNSLRISAVGGATLTWDLAPQGHAYDVYRGEVTPGTGLGDPVCLEPGLISRVAVDPLLPPAGTVFYFVVTGRNICGEGSAGVDSLGIERDDGWTPCPVVSEDYDVDGVLDLSDNCPDMVNAGQEDADLDFAGDPCDRCPIDPAKTDPGYCGCAVPDDDGDGDGLPDCVDNCPAVSNPTQTDSDGDGIGDLCDPVP